MNFKPKALAIAVSSIVLAACGGGGGGSSSSGGTTGGSTVTAQSYELPDQMEVVTTRDNATSQTVTTPQTLRALGNTARAFSDAGTDYSKAEQRVHTWVEALEPVGTANMIMCFVSQLNAEDMLDQGAYIAMVDMSKCEDGEAKGGGQNGQSGNSDDVKAFMKTIVQAQTNSDGTATVYTWMPEMEDGQAIRVTATIREGASDTKKIGDFTLQWEEYATSSYSGSPSGYGELKTIETLDTHYGFTLFDNWSGQEDFGSGPGTVVRTAAASVVINNDETDGVAQTAINMTFNGSPAGENAAFHIAFNENHVALDKAQDLASLDGNGDACLSRTSFKEAVWRYGLYRADTGALVKRNSGFPFKYDSDSDGDPDTFGYIGYWGAWMEGNQSLPDGATITKDNFGDNSQPAQQYTVNSTNGRLIKKEVVELPLSKLAGVEMNYWDSDLDTLRQNSDPNDDYDQWVVKYLTGSEAISGDGFYKVAGQSWGENGPQRSALSPVEKIDTTGMYALHLWSDQLGGSIQWKPGDTAVTYFKETVMNGSEAELATSDLALKCVDRCIKAGLTKTDLQTWDGAYEPPATNLGSGYDYTIKRTDLNAYSGATALTFPTLTEQDKQSLAQGWGVQSGPMVTADVYATLSTPEEIYDPAKVTTFYVWEMGPENWNKTLRVTDSNGNLVNFDQPLVMSYTHTTANDRDGDSSHDGQVYRLEYAGPGDLHGIPFAPVGCDLNTENCDGKRWYPEFNLKDGAVVYNDGSVDYVVKAWDIERSMLSVSQTNCSSLAFGDLPQPVPTRSTVNVDLSGMPDMPTVTDAPAFVGGESTAE